MSIGFRQAEVYDVPELTRISEECFGETAGMHVKWKHLYSILTNNAISVVVACDKEDPNDLLGYVRTRTGNGLVHLISLAVEVESRYQGIGRRLLAFSTAKMSQQNPQLAVVVNERLTNGLKWLCKAGFSVHRQMHEVYGGDDGIEMRMALNVEPSRFAKVDGIPKRAK